MINILKISLFFSIAGFVLSGCQTVPYQGEAHDVKRKPQVAGIVAVPSNPRPEDRARADEHMKSNCGELAVRVLEEGEVVIGQETQGTSNENNRDDTRHKAGSLFGLPIMSGNASGKDTSTSSTTKSLKEWQISYECGAKEKTKLR
jgi:hypothetical protein